MRTMTLEGRLGVEFGGPFRLDVRTPAEAVRALISQLPGFHQALSAGNWHVRVGDEELDENQLLITAPGDYVISPALVGAGGGRGKAVGKIVVGVALAAAAFYVGGPGASAAVAKMATIGLSMGVAIGLSGIAMLMAQAPHKTKATKDKSSYLFDGPVNSDAEGGVVPLIYGGPIRTGGTIISGSIVSETTKGWQGPVLGNPFTTTHSLEVGTDDKSGYSGYRVLKFGDLDPRNVNSSTYIREMSYGSREKRLYFSVDTAGLEKGWLEHITLSKGDSVRFTLQGFQAGYVGGSGYTQWYWDLVDNPMTNDGEDLTLEVERTA